MKRIYAILSGKLEDIKLKNKVKRVENALNNAEVNAQDEIIAADDAMSDAVSSLSKEGVEVESVVSQLHEAIIRKKEAEEGLENIKTIRQYLNEEIAVEEPKKK